MKYEIQIHKTERKTIVVFASNPNAALDLALSDKPGFTAEMATELLDQDESGKTFEVFGHCESCNARIMTGEKYFQYGGDEPVITCEKCGGDPGMQAEVAP